MKKLNLPKLGWKGVKPGLFRRKVDETGSPPVPTPHGSFSVESEGGETYIAVYGEPYKWAMKKEAAIGNSMAAADHREKFQN